MTQCEVAIIGAGPAGCVAARLLATWGHDVTVCGRRPNAERTLAESLPPSCVSLLERVGITGLDAAGFLRSTGNTVLWGDGEERVESFAPGLHGYQVERAPFDAFLAREATGAGADVRLGASVTGVERGAASTISYERDGNAESVAAPWVIDCSGRSGVVARDLRTAAPADAGTRSLALGTTGEALGTIARTTAIVGVWERDDEWPTADQSHTIVESTEDGWAWSVPVSKSRRYVTLMVDPTITKVASREGLDAAYFDHLGRTRRLSALVKGARGVGQVFARDASPYSSRSFGEPGMLVAGDAASFVDPLSSYGIKKAVASAWLASVVVHSTLLNDSMTAAALELYNARERAMYAALARSAAALARDAGGAHQTPFWEARGTTIDGDLPGEPDAAALRSDHDVLRAFGELRERDTMRVRTGALVRRESRPTVRGNRVVVEDHLVVPAFPAGVRYIRNVDLLQLSELAVTHDQVADVFEAYNRAASPVPLPDFLGALSVLIGKGFLEWSLA